MYEIANRSNSTYPAIVAVGEDEVQACAVYATLHNAHCILNTDELGTLLTNVASGVIYTTLLTTEWKSFDELAEHIAEVHGVTIWLELFN